MAKRKSKMPLSKAKTAYELLGEIRKIILEEPKRYDQTEIIVLGVTGENAPECGTVGCVAGWAAVLKRKYPRHGTAESSARRILGLDHYQAYLLFRATAAKGVPQTKRHAISGAAHIARFMKKHEAQLKAKSV